MANGNIIPATNGQLAVNIGHTTEISWEPPADLTYDGWEKIGNTLQTVNAAVNWWIGDWLAFGERSYGDTYVQAVNVTDSSIESLKKYKAVSERVPPEIRVAGLSWTHHFYVTYIPEDERGPLLAIAESFELSSRELKELTARIDTERRLIIGMFTENPPGTYPTYDELLGNTVDKPVYELQEPIDGETYQNTPSDPAEPILDSAEKAQNGDPDSDLPFDEPFESGTEYLEDDEMIAMAVLEFFEEHGVVVTDTGDTFMEFDSDLTVRAELTKDGEPISTMANNVTTKAMMVYVFIVQYKQRHDGNSPPYRTIAAGLDYKSVAVIQHYIAALKDAGLIRAIDGHIEVGGKWLPPHQMGVK